MRDRSSSGQAASRSVTLHEGSTEHSLYQQVLLLLACTTHKQLLQIREEDNNSERGRPAATKRILATTEGKRQRVLSIWLSLALKLSAGKTRSQITTSPNRDSTQIGQLDLRWKIQRLPLSFLLWKCRLENEKNRCGYFTLNMQ